MRTRRAAGKKELRRHLLQARRLTQHSGEGGGGREGGEDRGEKKRGEQTKLGETGSEGEWDGAYNVQTLRLMIGTITGHGHRREIQVCVAADGRGTVIPGKDSSSIARQQNSFKVT